MNGYRNYDLKVTGQTIKRLRLSLELYPAAVINDSGERAGLGIDALAENLINDQIATNFPKVLELEKAQAKFKSQWIKDKIENAQSAAK